MYTVYYLFADVSTEMSSLYTTTDHAHTRTLIVYFAKTFAAWNLKLSAAADWYIGTFFFWLGWLAIEFNVTIRNKQPLLNGRLLKGIGSPHGVGCCAAAAAWHRTGSSSDKPRAK